MEKVEPKAVDPHRKLSVLLLTDNITSNDIDGNSVTQRILSKKKLNIPICDVHADQEYEKNVRNGYVVQHNYVKHAKKIGDEVDVTIDYVLDSADKSWVAARVKAEPGSPGKELQRLFTFDAFETIVNILERYTAFSKDPIPLLHAQKLIVEQLNWPSGVAQQALAVSVIGEVYSYWLKKREVVGKPLCRRYWPQIASSDSNPHQVFRTRDKERYRLRKTQKRNDVESFRKMQQLRREFSRAKVLLELVLEREMLREADFTVQREMFAQRCFDIQQVEEQNEPQQPNSIGISESGNNNSSSSSSSKRRADTLYRHKLKFDHVDPNEWKHKLQQQQHAAALRAQSPFSQLMDADTVSLDGTNNGVDSSSAMDLCADDDAPIELPPEKVLRRIPGTGVWRFVTPKPSEVAAAKRANTVGGASSSAAIVTNGMRKSATVADSKKGALNGSHAAASSSSGDNKKHAGTAASTVAYGSSGYTKVDKKSKDASATAAASSAASEGKKKKKDKEAAAASQRMVMYTVAANGVTVEVGAAGTGTGGADGNGHRGANSGYRQHSGPGSHHSGGTVEVDVGGGGAESDLRIVHADLDGPDALCQPQWPSFMAANNVRDHAAVGVQGGGSSAFYSDYLDQLELRRDEQSGELLRPMKYRSRCRVGRGGRVVMDRIPVYEAPLLVDADYWSTEDAAQVEPAPQDITYIYPTSLRHQQCSALAKEIAAARAAANAALSTWTHEGTGAHNMCSIPPGTSCSPESAQFHYGAMGALMPRPLPELPMSNRKVQRLNQKIRASNALHASNATIACGAHSGHANASTHPQPQRLLPEIPSFAPSARLILTPANRQRLSAVCAESDSEDERVTVPRARRGYPEIEVRSMVTKSTIAAQMAGTSATTSTVTDSASMSNGNSTSTNSNSNSSNVKFTVRI